MSDYYKILGVSKDASLDEIKKSFKALAVKHHPDKNKGAKNSEEKFKEINEAFQTLSDKDKRAIYDSGGRNPNQPWPDFGGFGDFSGFGSIDPNKPRPGNNIILEANISPYEAIVGKQKTAKYSFSYECESCLDTCPTCNGQGGVSRVMGNMHIQQTCGACRGSGKKHTGKECSICNKSGVITENKIGNITIPPGVQNGAQLGVAGGGTPGKNGGRQGGLIVVIKIVYPDVKDIKSEDIEHLKRIFGESN
jgi:molecular chaperone DnaJ